jgi:hypothetical protein
MTASLALKLMVTAFLIWTFAVKEYWVLILYAVYRLLVYLESKIQNPKSNHHQTSDRNQSRTPTNILTPSGRLRP